MRNNYKQNNFDLLFFIRMLSSVWTKKSDITSNCRPSFFRPLKSNTNTNNHILIIYNITKFRQNIIWSIKKHQNKNYCVQLYRIYMVIFNFTKIFPLIIFNCAWVYWVQLYTLYSSLNHCALSSELSEIGQFFTKMMIHSRRDGSTKKVEQISRSWKLDADLANIDVPVCELSWPSVCSTFWERTKFCWTLVCSTISAFCFVWHALLQ